MDILVTYTNMTSMASILYFEPHQFTNVIIISQGHLVNIVPCGKVVISVSLFTSTKDLLLSSSIVNSLCSASVSQQSSLSQIKSIKLQ